MSLSAGAAPMPQGNYLIGGGFVEMGDSNRHSDHGLGLNLGVGFLLEDRPGEAIEISITGVERDRDVDGRSDYQQSVFVNWLKAFDAKYIILDATPYVLLGGGGIREDVRGRDHLHAGVDGGAGLRFELPIEGWLLRTEALAQLQLNNDSVSGHDTLIDYQARVLLQVPIGAWRMPSFESSAPELPPETATGTPRCESSFYDPVSGREICSTDSDRDGVVDEADICPQTPRGAPVDARGCPANVDTSAVADQDGDGVPDVSDQCPTTAPALTVDAKGCVVQQTVTLESIRFDTGSALLTPGAKTVLDGLARTLRGQTNLFTQIRGHTDDEGVASFNQLLSEQRAGSVRQYLIQKSVPSSRLSSKGLGESEPMVPNDTSENREKNRRIEFILSISGS
jgi:OOP family OmpA-OmpF porin